MNGRNWVAHVILRKRGTGPALCVISRGAGNFFGREPLVSRYLVPINIGNRAGVMRYNSAYREPETGRALCVRFLPFIPLQYLILLTPSPSWMRKLKPLHRIS